MIVALELIAAFVLIVAARSRSPTRSSGSATGSILARARSARCSPPSARRCPSR
jgi:hypothetical protein